MTCQNNAVENYKTKHNKKPRGGNQSTEHSNLVEGIRLALGLRSDVTTWKVHAGLVRPYKSNQYIRLEGSHADLCAVVLPGLHLELEVKTGNAVQNEGQKNWQANVNHKGGYYFVVRSVEEAVSIVDDLPKQHIAQLKKLGLV